MTASEEWLPNVLVVDDSATRRQLLVDWFKERGFQVTQAGDGREALQFLGTMSETERVQLVVSDVNMPEMNGIELTKRIRSSPMLESLTVILYTTSRLDAESRREGLRAGAADYLRGAVDYERLWDAIDLKVRGLKNLRKLAEVREQMSRPPRSRDSDS